MDKNLFHEGEERRVLDENPKAESEERTAAVLADIKTLEVRLGRAPAI
jgi:hypothetical protein